MDRGFRIIRVLSSRPARGSDCSDFWADARWTHSGEIGAGNGNPELLDPAYRRCTIGTARYKLRKPVFYLASDYRPRSSVKNNLLASSALVLNNVVFNVPREIEIHTFLVTNRPRLGKLTEHPKMDFAD